MSLSCVSIFTDTRYAQSSWFKETYAGICASASRNKLTVRTYESEPLPEELETLPRAVIVAGGAHNCLSNNVTFLTQYHKQVVLAGIDSELFSEPVSCATLNRRAETERLVAYLHQCKKTRIALFGFQPRSINDMIRYHAALSAAEAGGQPISRDGVFFCRSSIRECFAKFLPWATCCDAVICPNDIVAVYFIGSAKKNGIAVPEDLFVTGFSNMSIGQHCNPSLTTIAMDMFAVGTSAFDAWHFLQKNSDSTVQIKIEVPAKLLVRSSTAHIAEQTHPSGVHMVDHGEDAFYGDVDIQQILRLNNCLSLRDRTDLQIIAGIVSGLSYENIAERLFLSISTIRYRAHKIYSDAGAKGKVAFLAKLTEYLNGAQFC